MSGYSGHSFSPYRPTNKLSERLLNDLLSVPANSPDLHSALMAQALSHYAVYLERLLRHSDIFLVLSAYWLTPFERSFFWFGGLKPHILFSFTPSDINEDQRSEIDKLKQRSAHRESQLEAMIREMEETMRAYAVITELHGNAINGEARAATESAINSIMCTIFQEADKLRKHVVSRKLKVLNTNQGMHFLASVMSLQISTHEFCLHHTARV